MIHIGECTQLPAQYELDKCSAVEVLSSSSRHKKTLRRFVEVLLSPRSTTNTADLPKFSLKIYIKHCRFVEVPSLFKIHNKHCRFVEVLLSASSTTNTANLSKFLLSSRSTTNTAYLSEFFSLQAPPQTLQFCRSSSLFKIHNKHCRFVGVLLSSSSTTNTANLSKFFSLQDPQQTLHIRRFFRTGSGTSSTESGNIVATQDGCDEIPRTCMHRIDQFVSPPRRPQIFVVISGGSEQDLDLFLSALHV
jgi:hypothetical protein